MLKKGFFRDFIFVTLVATAILLPMVGMVLDGYAIDFKIPRFLSLLAGVVALSMLLRNYGAALRRFSTNLESRFGTGFRVFERNKVLSIVGVVLVLVILPHLPGIGNYHVQILSLTLIYVLLALGLNIVVGLAGLLDLGYVAFFAAGAYGYALFNQYAGLSFWLAIPVMAVVASIVGGILAFPVLRMHGDYLAIVTLGFGEVVRLLMTNMIDITGGPNGISAERPSLFGLSFIKNAPEGQIPFHEFFNVPYSPFYRYLLFYYLLIVVCGIAIFTFMRLREMPVGRSWEALRDDEIACRAMGINHVTTKLSAFMLGASFGGVGGVIFAGMEGFINPSSFSFQESALIVAMVVLGGMGTVVGVIIATAALVLLPELFREFAAYRMVVFGLAMIIIMIWKPTGMGSVTRRVFQRK